MTKKPYAYILILALLVSIELISIGFPEGRSAGLAAKTYITQYLCALLAGLYLYAKTLKEAYNKKEKVYFFSSIFILALLVFPVGNINFADISYESALQVKAGIEGYSKKDFNYYGRGFIDYPARQYLIVALPALISGESIFSLHLGYAQFFILGYFLLSAGLYQHGKLSGRAANVSLYPIIFLLSTPAISEFYLIFEQTILPASLAMICIGSFLLFYKKASTLNILLVAWCGSLLPYFYTPAKALIPLYILLLFFIKPNNYKDQSQTGLKLTLFLYSLFFAVVFVFVFFEKSSEGTKHITDGFSILQFIGSFWGIIKSNQLGWEFIYGFFGPLNLLVFAYVLASLLNLNKKNDLIICFWFVLVLFFAAFLRGYTSYDMIYKMTFRSLIVFPVVYFFFVEFVTRSNRLLRVLKKDVVLLSVLLLLFSCLVYNTKSERHYMKYMNHITPMKHVISKIQNDIDSLPREDVQILFFHPEGSIMGNFYDYSAYFFDDIEVHYATDIRFQPKNKREHIFRYALDGTVGVDKEENGYEPVEFVDWRLGKNLRFYKHVIKNSLESGS